MEKVAPLNLDQLLGNRAGDFYWLPNWGERRRFHMLKFVAKDWKPVEIDTSWFLVGESSSEQFSEKKLPAWLLQVAAHAQWEASGRGRQYSADLRLFHSLFLYIHFLNYIRKLLPCEVSNRWGKTTHPNVLPTKNLHSCLCFGFQFGTQTQITVWHFRSHAYIVNFLMQIFLNFEKFMLVKWKRWKALSHCYNVCLYYFIWSLYSCEVDMTTVLIQLYRTFCFLLKITCIVKTELWVELRFYKVKSCSLYYITLSFKDFSKKFSCPSKEIMGL